MNKLVIAMAPPVVACGTWLTRHVISARSHRWRPGAGSTRRVGRLSVREFGTGDPVIVLLHGLAASQSYFGSAYDRLAESATVVVPDLLGFGRSQQIGRDEKGDFSIADHCSAISEVIRADGLEERPILLVGHSMGAALALSLAAEGSFDVRGVIAFGAPLYRTREEAEQHMHNMGWFEALLSSGPIARALCAWMCRYRTIAEIAAVIANPRLPIRVASDGVRHTWASYIQSFETVVESRDWEDALGALASLRIPIDLVYGDSDRVPVLGRAHQLQQTYSNVSATHRRGHHDLPLAEAEWCARYITQRLDALISPGIGLHRAAGLLRQQPNAWRDEVQAGGVPRRAGSGPRR